MRLFAQYLGMGQSAPYTERDKSFTERDLEVKTRVRGGLGTPPPSHPSSSSSSDKSNLANSYRTYPRDLVPEAAGEEWCEMSEKDAIKMPSRWRKRTLS